jgi:hypothetical protein
VITPSKTVKTYETSPSAALKMHDTYFYARIVSIINDKKKIYMVKKAEIKKTIALPLSVHEKASELAKRIGLKQYEFIAAAILLAETDENFLQEILNTHAKKFALNGLDADVRKKLEELSLTELDALLNLVKKK